MRYNTVKDYEKSLSGGEPSWKNGETSLVKALNWYSYHSDNKESKKFTLSYLKEVKSPKKDIELLEKVNENDFENLGFVCRMKLRGAPLSEKNNQWIVNKIQELKTKTKIEPVVTVTNTTTIQERVENKAKEYIGEIEGIIDDCLKIKNFSFIDPYQMMQGFNIKPAYVTHINRFAQKRIDELDNVIKSRDTQVKEGYSNLEKSVIKDYLQFLKDIITDAEKISHTAKITRKPRKKKVKPVDKVVENMKFKKEDNSFKIASINPTNIVGSVQLWVFNTKTRKLGVYNSVDVGGLQVKGATIKNFNESTSIQKTLRKPEDVLHNCLNAGKITLRKLLQNVNAKEQVLTGRINSDTILLRVIK